MIDLSSKPNLKILGYFFMNEPEVFPSELAVILGMDKSNLRKKLVSFEEKGILVSEYKGRERYYHLNKDHPLYESYLEIIKVTYGMESIIKDEFSVKKDAEIYLYGSYVTGETDGQSDIDILIISTEKRASFIPIIRNLENVFNKEVSFVLLSPQEFKEKRYNDPFIKRVFQEGVKKIK